MAGYTTIGLPNESQFRTPGMATAAYEAESSKRANYLTQMDQFYAGLKAQKEMQRRELGAQAGMAMLQSRTQEKLAGQQADLQREGLAWEKEKFGQGLGWEKEQFGKTFGEQQRQFDTGLGWEKEKLGQQLGASKEELEKQLGWAKESFYKELEAEKEQNQWQQGIAQQQMDLAKSQFGWESGAKFAFEQEMGRGQMGLQQSQLDLAREQFGFESGAQFDFQKEMGIGQLDISRQGLDVQRLGLEQEGAYQTGMLGLQGRELDYTIAQGDKEWDWMQNTLYPQELENQAWNRTMMERQGTAELAQAGFVWDEETGKLVPGQLGKEPNYWGPSAQDIMYRPW